ncbi:MAG TPA: hypothetical protein VGG57_19030 [Stellaceae bacterium]|jgi:hypothetical protein
MARISPRSRTLETLPYRIELAGAADDERRILARAMTLQLARAIFRAASEEHPDARITLRRGNRILGNSEPKMAPGASSARAGR